MNIKKKILLLTIPIVFSSCLFFNIDYGFDKFFENKDGSIIYIKNAPMDWAFDCNFPERYKRFVRSGFHYWNKTAGYKLFTEVECQYYKTYNLVFVTDKRKELFDSQNNGLRTHATAKTIIMDNEIIGGLITYYKPWFKSDYDKIRDNISRHEIGHILGMQHINKKNCLMFQSINDNGRSYYYFNDKDMCKEEKELFNKIYK